MTQAIVLDAAPFTTPQVPAAPEGDGSFALDLEAALSETPTGFALEAILENPEGAAQAAAEALSMLQDGAAVSAELLVALENIAAGYVPADVEDTLELLNGAFEEAGLEQSETADAMPVVAIPAGQREEKTGESEPDTVQTQAAAVGGVPEMQVTVSPEPVAPPVSETQVGTETAPEGAVAAQGESAGGQSTLPQPAAESTQPSTPEAAGGQAAQTASIEEQAAPVQVIPAEEAHEVSAPILEQAAEEARVESVTVPQGRGQVSFQAENAAAEPTSGAERVSQALSDTDSGQVVRVEAADKGETAAEAQPLSDTGVASAVAANPAVSEEMAVMTDDAEQSSGEVAAPPVDESLGAMQGGESTAARTEGAQSGEPVSSGVDQERIISRIANTISQASEGERHTVRLRLFPPELGTVRVEVSSVRGTLSVRIETSTAEAQSAIHSNVAALERQLSDGGLETRNINVEYRDPSSHFGAWRQPGHDGRYRQTTRQQDSRSDTVDEGPDEEKAHAALATAGSINVLI